MLGVLEKEKAINQIMEHVKTRVRQEIERSKK